MIRTKELSLEEKFERVRQFRPIHDVFFEVLADSTEFCQEILRVILEDPELTVEDVVVQSSRRNLYGRSVRLDALCTLGDGVKCNIEVQRAADDDHARRVRFNASSITVKESQTGEDFKDIAEVYVIYISEFDIFKKGRTIYHVDNVIRETGDVVEDGLHRIFVNTVCDDGTDIAELMSCFTKEMFNNPKFPVFSRRMMELKREEKGVNAMCELMEKYIEEGREEGRVKGREEGRAEGRIKGLEEGRAEGREEGRAELIMRMLQSGKTPEEIVSFTGISLEEVLTVEESLSVNA